MRSSNPAIKKVRNLNEAVGFGAANPATYGGVGLKVMYYLALTIVSAIVFVALPLGNATTGVLIGMLIVGMICGFLACTSPKATMICGSIYCVAEGAMIGLISALFDALVQGVIIMALLSTVLTLAVIALLYFTGVVRVGSKFRRFIMSALIALVLSQLVFMLLSLFVPSVSTAFYGSFWLQLIITVVFIVIAALSLFTDFDDITMIVENGMDKSCEWMAAYGLVLTLIWLYLEFLRLAVLILGNRD